MNKRILILCTGNSARSQMAEGFLKSFDSSLQVFSAGTNPVASVNRFAIQVMKEVGVDISSHLPKNVNVFLNQSFDFVITVCNNAKKTCPVFIGKVGKQLHIGFEDPADATGTEKEVLSVFRKVRDEIKRAIFSFFNENLKTK